MLDDKRALSISLVEEKDILMLIYYMRMWAPIMFLFFFLTETQIRLQVTTEVTTCTVTIELRGGGEWF